MSPAKEVLYGAQTFIHIYINNTHAHKHTRSKSSAHTTTQSFGEALDYRPLSLYTNLSYPHLLCVSKLLGDWQDILERNMFSRFLLETRNKLICG